jgi:hypothetical protein
MSAFALISTMQSNPALEAKVMEVYPNDNYRVSPTVWFVADKNITTQGVCQKLNVGADGVDNIIAIKVDSYWGRAPKTAWEWLSVKGSDS